MMKRLLCVLLMLVLCMPYAVAEEENPFEGYWLFVTESEDQWDSMELTEKPSFMHFSKDTMRLWQGLDSEWEDADPYTFILQESITIGDTGTYMYELYGDVLIILEGDQAIVLERVTEEQMKQYLQETQTDSSTSINDERLKGFWEPFSASGELDLTDAPLLFFGSKELTVFMDGEMNFSSLYTTFDGLLTFAFNETVEEYEYDIVADILVMKNGEEEMALKKAELPSMK